MPDVLEISDPPINVRNKKYNVILSGTFEVVIPELLRLLKTPIIILEKSKSILVINNINEQIMKIKKIKISS